jgi:hypothetical protein
MNRREVEKISIPEHSVRWTKRPAADGDCCEKHRREKRADDRKRMIAEERKRKWTSGS